MRVSLCRGKHRDFFFQPVGQGHFGVFHFIMSLNAGSELHRHPKIVGQTQRCVGADAAFTAHNLAEPKSVVSFASALARCQATSQL
jgi:hypothetical protein